MKATIKIDHAEEGRIVNAKESTYIYLQNAGGTS
jgi:hypothetical protein